MSLSKRASDLPPLQDSIGRPLKSGSTFARRPGLRRRVGLLYTNATFRLKTWQSEDEINARLRELTRDVRLLRNELLALAAARPSDPRVARSPDPPPTTTQPLDEERKLRLIPKRRRQ